MRSRLAIFISLLTLFGAFAFPKPVAFKSTGGGDPFFSSVVLLLHMNGTNTSTTFTDSGPLVKTTTPTGNAQLSTTNPKFGSASGLFDGTGDILSEDGSAVFAFGTGNFTIECWVNQAALGVRYFIYDGRPAATTGAYPQIEKTTGNVIIYVANAATQITGTTALATNTWYHVAVCRSGTNTRLFINGTQEGSTYSDSTTYLNPGSRPQISNNGNSGGNSWNGNIDEFRVTTAARYTGNFTAPTAEFPNN